MSWLERTASGHRFRFATRRDNRWTEPVTIAEGDRFFANWADVPSVVRLPDGSIVAHWLQTSGPGQVLLRRDAPALAGQRPHMVRAADAASRRNGDGARVRINRPLAGQPVRQQFRSDLARRAGLCESRQPRRSRDESRDVAARNRTVADDRRDDQRERCRFPARRRLDAEQGNARRLPRLRVLPHGCRAHEPRRRRRVSRSERGRSPRHCGCPLREWTLDRWQGRPRRQLADSGLSRERSGARGVGIRTSRSRGSRRRRTARA